MKAALKRAHPAGGFRKAGAPTPLLRFLAGEHADAIALDWPAPHEEFLALPAARRHAAAILLRAVDGPELRALVTRGRDAVVAARILPDRDTAGLMKALGRMGERLWSRADYARFLDLFGEPNANRVLRHLDTVTPDTFAPIEALPDLLREAPIVAAIPGLPGALDLGAAFDLALRIRGVAEAHRIAARWNRAKDRRRLFEMAAEDLVPEVFLTPTPAPVLPGPFERVTTRKQLHATALAFQNCLRDFTNDVAVGRMAVWVWRGAPNAAVAMTWDQAGWRLAEAEAAANTELQEPPLREIVDAVLAAGGRTGPGVNALVRRLFNRGNGDLSHDPPGQTWVERLELGDLWD
ncbi:MAG: hypothetical protein AAFQ67_03325 [Pseudomonadota bacterium]